jgi:GntR family transcriptional regulator
MPRVPRRAAQVAEEVAARIAGGTYLPGAWLPGGPTLGEEFGVDRGTVRRALLMLQERGLVEVVEGNGARVRKPSRHETSDMTVSVGQWRGFGAAVSRAGGEPYTEPTAIREIEAPSRVAQILGIPAGTTVLERDRVHGEVVGGERRPVEIATSWITMPVVERLPVLREVNTGPGGMTVRIEEAGYRMAYEDVVTSRLADSGERERLQIDEHQPVTDVVRRTYDQTGVVIKASRRVINPARHELVYRYPPAT